MKPNQNQMSGENFFALSRLKNQTNSAEGSNLLPRLIGGFRVPFVTNLRLLNTISVFGQTQFTLSWDEPDIPVSRYNIYVVNAINNNTPPLGPYTCQRAPAQILIPAQSVANVTFIVQTVLNNGYVSDLNNSPTCAGVTTATTGTVTIGTIANGTPGQLISWNASSVATAFGPGAANSILTGSGAGALPAFQTIAALDLVKGASTITAVGQIPYTGSSGTLATIAAGAVDSILVGSGAGVAPQFKTLTTLDLVVGRGNLTTAGAVPYVSASGTLNQDATKFFWDSSTHRLGIGNAAPAVDLDITGFYNWSGQKRVSTQFDTTSTTLATVTGLSVTVTAAKVYYFRARLHVTADVVGGQKYAIGGSATATAIIYQVNTINNGTNLNIINSKQVALGGAVGQAGGTDDYTTIDGTITVNAGGTLVVQFAQNAAGGTSSVLVGSLFEVQQIA